MIFELLSEIVDLYLRYKSDKKIDKNRPNESFNNAIFHMALIDIFMWHKSFKKI